MSANLTLSQLRHYAIARTLFAPTSLTRAIARLGFVQADPIRAPARAQDLILRLRVKNYRAGQLEQRYVKLAIEEDFFVNYGYMPRAHQALMHPREPRATWTSARRRQADAVLEFIGERAVHPREVDAQFSHGKVTNWFGGSSNASTQLLDAMHYHGLLRVARRDGGTRVYCVRAAFDAPSSQDEINARLDALVDLIVAKYAPLPMASLGQLLSHLNRGVPQWRGHRGATLARAIGRLNHQTVDGIDWFWPCHESPTSRRWKVDEQVRLLAPFDPLVWDRRRFALFWSWDYRFEAYTPAPKRKLGYYAMPLLWGNQVIGWSNLAVKDGKLDAIFGYVTGQPPTSLAFRRALDQELDRVRTFLGADSEI
jgi:uncharacterized protein